MKYLVRGREHNCPVIHNSRSCQIESLVTGGAGALDSAALNINMVLTFSINLLLSIFIHVYHQILVLLSYQIQHIQNISFITQMHVSMYRILERNGRNTIIDQPSDVRPDMLIYLCVKVKRYNARYFIFYPFMCPII